MTTCKTCNYYKDSGVCTLKHIRVNINTQSCKDFNDTKQSDEIKHTCINCKHHYFPDESYPNYRMYISHEEKFFMVKCKFDQCGHFFNEKCKKHENQ